MENELLYTVKLAAGYNGTPVVKDISIHIRRSEILTLIGPNGAGKSTILKSITRHLAPLRGVVYLDGRPMNELTGSETAKRLAVLLTEHIKPEYMSCFEVAAAGRYPYTGRMGVLSANDKKCVFAALALVHAEELAGRDFARLSDGQKQRILLARAVCQEPEVLVLDEPTSFLDIRYKQSMLENIEKMAREKQLAVVMSLHEIDLAEKISDSILCVKDGRVDRYGRPDEIFSGNYIKELFGLESGSYNKLSGGLEFEAVHGNPKVFVIGGNGSGIPEYHRLRREGIPFAAGILHENDIDYPVASTLAAEIVTECAYYPISENTFFHAKTLIDNCEQVICKLNEFGPLNNANRLLARYAGTKLRT